MKVKTYKTHSLHEGLEDIKRDLGSEALILSTRTVSVRPRFSLFKKPAWEITAALEEKAASKPVPSPREARARQGEASINDPRPPLPERERPLPLLQAAAKQRVKVSTTAAAVAPARIVQKDSRMEELISEISDLKKSLRSLTRAIPGKSECRGGMFAELVSQGTDQDFADH